MCNPILATLLKMQPHCNQSSCENATPLASYKKVPPFPWDIHCLKDAQRRHFDDARRYFTDYLNFQISVVFLIFQMEGIFTSTWGVIQLAGQLSLGQRPHIDGHTVRVQIAVHSTAPFVWNPFSANHVTFQDFICYGFLEGYNAVTKCCKKKPYNLSLHSMRI